MTETDTEPAAPGGGAPSRKHSRTAKDGSMKPGSDCDARTVAALVVVTIESARVSGTIAGQHSSG